MNLFHVSSSHQLCSKVEVLTLCLKKFSVMAEINIMEEHLFKIKSDGLVCFLQVALVRVEHNCLFRVVSPHQLHSQPERQLESDWKQDEVSNLWMAGWK